MVVGDDGIIIIDPPMSLEAGEETLAAFRKVTDLPVRAIVYTHNHIDHVAAVKAFASEEQVAAGEIDIYAHETLMDGVINRASTVGPIEGRRASYTAGALVPKGPDGSVHDALGAEARVGTVTFIRPT
jgi:alkyl sulfatase BDS1-like metallo-beta-lactamase superfamily hydrolase